ncbi:hypothetical protein GCM10010172_46870 [Paractinoplanes ferrugineus]|uniref:Uncharacterized protein n=1 Tax=Paractinoplanes ferrugineus TaxID=113564 RepID=A0A919IWD7_9ACTN|nr:hypothetical protein [Actinoplanes ferrugineus]GIE10271.1 hypothetical protein Afe05nite_21110 [Actinoplanes ferrugineus]
MKLRQTLPGRWRVLATTFPMWLSGRRLDPTFTYETLPGEPLRLSDVVTYRTRQGATRRIAGVDRLDERSGVFTWRGRGVLKVLSSRWKVEHVSDDGDLVVLSFERSLVTPAGVDVIGRGPARRPDARDRVPAGFGALTWL